MSETRPENSDELAESSELEEEQEGKGYGTDEGERDEALEGA